MGKTTGYCVKCGNDCGSRSGGRLYCAPCRGKKNLLLTKAVQAVRREISCGRMPHPRTLTCKDCGDQARCYDHRSYDEPLKVEPVCYLCNKKRGPVSWKAA